MISATPIYWQRASRPSPNGTGLLLVTFWLRMLNPVCPMLFDISNDRGHSPSFAAGGNTAALDCARI
jgi:hypothetical protein